MPKGLFHLFWARLKAGKMVPGYVKNLASYGPHDRVYALVTPLEGGGYLSVRIKPSSEIFERVMEEYARR